MFEKKKSIDVKNVNFVAEQIRLRQFDAIIFFSIFLSIYVYVYKLIICVVVVCIRRLKF